MQDLQNELQAEFQKRLIPVIEEVAKEKGLYAVFSIADSGAAYVHARPRHLGRDRQATRRTRSSV